MFVKTHPIQIKSKNKGIKVLTKNDLSRSSTVIAAATWVEGPIQKVMETIKLIHGPLFYAKNCSEEANNNSITKAVVLETVEVYKSSQIIESFNVGIIGIKCYNDDYYNKVKNKKEAVARDQTRQKQMKTHLHGGNCYCFAEGTSDILDFIIFYKI